jgi:hypothetical protein
VGIFFTVGQIDLIFIGIDTEGIDNYLLWRTITVAIGTTREKYDNSGSQP